MKIVSGINFSRSGITGYIEDTECGTVSRINLYFPSNELEGLKADFNNPDLVVLTTKNIYLAQCAKEFQYTTREYVLPCYILGVTKEIHIEGYEIRDDLKLHISSAIENIPTRGLVRINGLLAVDSDGEFQSFTTTEVVRTPVQTMFTEANEREARRGEWYKEGGHQD